METKYILFSITNNKCMKWKMGKNNAARRREWEEVNNLFRYSIRILYTRIRESFLILFHKTYQCLFFFRKKSEILRIFRGSTEIRKHGTASLTLFDVKGLPFSRCFKILIIIAFFPPDFYYLREIFSSIKFVKLFS